MKQFLTGISLIIIATIVVSPFLPWWGISIVAIIIGGVVGLKGMTSFMYGFIGVGLVWLVTILLKNNTNEGILLGKMTDLFPIESPILLLFAILLIGGIVGGFSTATGGLLRQLLDSSKQN